MPIEPDQLARQEFEKNYGTIRSPLANMPAIGERIVPGVPEGAEPQMPPPPQTTFQDINGNLSKDDLRVRILVPPKYMEGLVF